MLLSPKIMTNFVFKYEIATAKYNDRLALRATAIIQTTETLLEHISTILGENMRIQVLRFLQAIYAAIVNCTAVENFSLSNAVLKPVAWTGGGLGG
jgi:hypothetical protein